MSVYTHACKFATLVAFAKYEVKIIFMLRFEGLGCGEVVLTMNLPHNKLKKCTLHDVLLVPGLAYNLLSVTLASKRGKETKFSEMTFEI